MVAPSLKDQSGSLNSSSPSRRAFLGWKNLSVTWISWVVVVDVVDVVVVVDGAEVVSGVSWAGAEVVVALQGEAFTPEMAATAVRIVKTLLGKIMMKSQAC